MRSLIPRRELEDIFQDENRAINYLIRNEVLTKPTRCDSCGNNHFRLEGKLWRCVNKSCRKRYSILRNSFFAQHKIRVNEILELLYYWLAKLSNDSIEMVMGLSSKTVCAFYEYARQLVSDSLDIDDLIIGGEDVIVEVDEAKFGKRKYNRGHPVDGVWILGGVERTVDRKCFLVEVPDRTAETLLSTISKHVHRGSIIYTDCFKSYSNLSNLFEHYDVNHSETFVDPDTGCHTNTIEGTWNGIKTRIRPRSRVSGVIDNHLGEFIWRRRNSSNWWTSLIKTLKETWYE